MRQYWIIYDCCPDCNEPLYFDTEAGETVPHRCPEKEDETWLSATDC